MTLPQSKSVIWQRLDCLCGVPRGRTKDLSETVLRGGVQWTVGRASQMVSGNERVVVGAGVRWPVSPSLVGGVCGVGWGGHGCFGVVSGMRIEAITEAFGHVGERVMRWAWYERGRRCAWMGDFHRPGFTVCAAFAGVFRVGRPGFVRHRLRR